MYLTFIIFDKLFKCSILHFSDKSVQEKFILYKSNAVEYIYLNNVIVTHYPAVRHVFR